MEIAVAASTEATSRAKGFSSRCLRLLNRPTAALSSARHANW